LVNEDVLNMREFYTTTLPPLSVRINLDTDSRIGPGPIAGEHPGLRFDLRRGSAMDMSYKRAWALVDEMNCICGRAACSQSGLIDPAGLRAYPPLILTQIKNEKATWTTDVRSTIRAT
jgi:hypothetical protein